MIPRPVFSAPTPPSPQPGAETVPGSGIVEGSHHPAVLPATATAQDKVLELKVGYI